MVCHVSSDESSETRERDHLTAARRLGSGTALTWVAWVAARALALVTLVLLTQALPAEDLGALLAALAAGLLGATLATGGLPDATTRNAIRGAGSGFGRGDVNHALIRFAAACPAILALVLAIVSRQAGALDWSVFAASTLLAVTQGGTSIVASIYRARGQAGMYALVTNLFTSIGRTGVAILALATGAGASIVLWAFVLLNVAVIVQAWGGAVSGLAPTTSSAHGTASLQLGGAVWSLLQNLDLVVVGLVVGASAAGVYGAALRLAEFTLLLLIAMTVLYLPEAVKLAIAGRREALVLFYRTSSRWCALISLLTAGTCFIVAPDLAQLLLPNHASSATTVLRILLPGYALHGAMGLAYATSVALGGDRTVRRAAVVAIPFLVVITVLSTELWGLPGAAAATLAGYVVLTIAWVLWTRDLLGALPFDRLYVRAVATCIVSWLSAGLAAYVTRGEAPLSTLLVTCLVAVLTWLPLVRFGGALSARELRALGRLRPGRIRVSRA
jgi:O-antigen/teichoic acid export membrane protein